MMRLAGRAAAFLSRFTAAAENLGIVSAGKLFAVTLFRIRREMAIHAERLNRDIHFRGADDKGAMSHFFSPGYRIVDTPGEPVRLIVDAGANIGDETIRFRYFHPDATIVALEPQSENLRLLSKNVEGDPNTMVIPKGLWSHECALKVVAGTSNEDFSVTEVPAREGDTEATSLNAILNLPFVHDRGLSDIDILKLDIEGAEYEVFSKNYEPWIHRTKVVIMECPDVNFPGTTMTVLRAFSAHDFNAYLCGENIVMIRRDVPWKLKVSAFLD